LPVNGDPAAQLRLIAAATRAAEQLQRRRPGRSDISAWRGNAQL